MKRIAAVLQNFKVNLNLRIKKMLWCGASYSCNILFSEGFSQMVKVRRIVLSFIIIVLLSLYIFHCWFLIFYTMPEMNMLDL